MRSNRELKELREGAEKFIEEAKASHFTPLYAATVITLIDQIVEMREIHTREQRASADRLREALEARPDHYMTRALES